MKHVQSPFSSKDVAEIAVGSCVMAFPIAVTEEVWTLGVELPLGRALLISLGSIGFIAWFVYELYYDTTFRYPHREIAKRVLSVYGLTLVIAASILLGVDQLPILDAPLVALKRTTIVAFPASFAATVVDSIPGRHGSAQGAAET
jgi:uncharacterized membrane protein